MRFVNTSPHDLKFEIDGKVYTATVGGCCEIPDRISHCIAARGLPLKPALAAPAKIETTEALAEAPAKLEMTEAELEAATAPDPAPVSRKRK